ncbi:MAG: LD-carboxypeptidase [Melioribacteraceae bacterium]|jgi:muramoyltetrapeptide carboxypeptidase|nr:LD-carboxypeptidase [Melioribacteraceae bacterium]
MKRRTFIRNTALFTGASSMSGISNIYGNTQSKTNMPPKIKPMRLNKGDTVGLIAPAGYISDNALQDAIENIESLGFKPYYTNEIKSKYGYLAGKDEVRANDLNHMFENDKVDGIFCVRGGYGVARMLREINYDAIKANPKVLVGYSDITALHYAIYSQTGLITFHGPVATSTFNEFSVDNLIKTIMSPQPKTVFTPADDSDRGSDFDTYTIREGKASGELIGGNLSLAVTFLGTPYDVDYKGKILYLEEIDEKPYRVDRMLTHLYQAGKLEEVAGIALGVFRKCNAKIGSAKGEQTLSLKEVLYNKLYDLGVPVIYGLSFGHVENKYTIPFGINAELDVQKQTITLTEPAVL